MNPPYKIHYYVMNEQLEGRRKQWVRWFLAVSLLLTLIVLFLWWFFFWERVYTDDAYVQGNQVYITPLVPGFVTAIHTDDTFLVKEGDLLVQLDETNARLALLYAKKNLGNSIRQVCQAFHDVFIYKEEIEIIVADLIRAIQDYHHRKEAIQMESVSVEDLEHATAALRASYHQLKSKEAHYKKASSFVQGTSIRQHPLVQTASSQFRLEWVRKYRCKIFSPVTGLVAQRKVQVGMHVKEGEPLMSVIPLHQIWVNANFKETQMCDMRIGQTVELRSDLYGDKAIYHGTIVGLPGAAGNAFSLLPPQNLSGNWIKIVQRLPVRVALNEEELIKYPLRIGLSMEAFASTSNQQGLLVPIATNESPIYSTNVFEKEEGGDLEAVEEILKENIDPTLAEYLDLPLEIKTLNIESLISDLKTQLTHLE